MPVYVKVTVLYKNKLNCHWAGVVGVGMEEAGGDMLHEEA